jgi:DNA-binding response OmpR family regulator
MLAMNANRVIPYSRLVEYAWGYDSGDANLLKTHICHIREKLSMPLDAKTGIKAVPGVGYRLVPSN